MQVKSVSSKFKCTTIYNNKKVDKVSKLRTVAISKFSKLQFYFDFSMESLFLAVDLFDKYFQICAGDLDGEVIDVALACLMIAIKYEEIYPPTLDQIQTRIGTRLDYKEYVQLQVEVLKKLGYNVTV